MKWRKWAMPRDIDNLQRRLRAIPREMKVHIREALDKSADEMVATIRGLAPVDDGVLRDSVGKAPGDHDMSVKVHAGGKATTRETREGSGVAYDYALGVEHGTVDTPAQPFFWPGYRINRKRVKARAKRAVTNAVKSSKKG
jgi:HK97 gp10 family phage protein